MSARQIQQQVQQYKYKTTIPLPNCPFSLSFSTIFNMSDLRLRLDFLNNNNFGVIFRVTGNHLILSFLLNLFNNFQHVRHLECDQRCARQK